jgi:hypothetical protein
MSETETAGLKACTTSATYWNNRICSRRTAAPSTLVVPGKSTVTLSRNSTNHDGSVGGRDNTYAAAPAT